MKKKYLLEYRATKYQYSFSSVKELEEYHEILLWNSTLPHFKLKEYERSNFKNKPEQLINKVSATSDDILTHF
jgi:hypothetical protein